MCTLAVSSASMPLVKPISVEKNIRSKEKKHPKNPSHSQTQEKALAETIKLYKIVTFTIIYSYLFHFSKCSCLLKVKLKSSAAHSCVNCHWVHPLGRTAPICMEKLSKSRQGLAAWFHTNGSYIATCWLLPGSVHQINDNKRRNIKIILNLLKSCNPKIFNIDFEIILQRCFWNFLKFKSKKSTNLHNAKIRP